MIASQNLNALGLPGDLVKNADSDLVDLLGTWDSVFLTDWHLGDGRLLVHGPILLNKF